MSEAAQSLTLKAFRNRFALGGYWWTMRVNQTAGAYMARSGIRRGLHPNNVTLLATAIGTATSALVILIYEQSSVAAGAVGLAGWQLTYSLDCADGQIARATGRDSPRGALLDLLCDFVVHVGVALAGLYVVSVSVEWNVAIPAGVIVAAWLISPYYKCLLDILPDGMKSVGKSSLHGVLRHTRDFGIYVAILPVAIMFSPTAVFVVLISVSVLEFAALSRGIWSYSRREVEVPSD